MQNITAVVRRPLRTNQTLFIFIIFLTYLSSFHSTHLSLLPLISWFAEMARTLLNEKIDGNYQKRIQ